MATADFAAVSGVKVRGGVFGPATCARSAVKPPTPATAEKKLLREKFITCLQNPTTDYQTLLYIHVPARTAAFLRKLK
jgi:hypothetical protein